MIKDRSPREYDVILRSDLGWFAERCFSELNPQAPFLPNWHIKVIAAKLTRSRGGLPATLDGATISTLSTVTLSTRTP